MFTHRPNAKILFGDVVTTFGPRIELWPPFSRSFRRGDPSAFVVRLSARSRGNSFLRLLTHPFMGCRGRRQSIVVKIAFEIMTKISQF